MKAREVAALVSWSRVLAEVGADSGHNSRTRCPIHGGSNPTAFSFSDETSTARCFSCGWHGGKISFLEMTLGVNFKTALGRLAAMAGVKLAAFRKPDRVQELHSRAHRAALEGTRQDYQQWCHDRWRLLIEFNDKYLAEQSDADEALRLAQKFPRLLTDAEIEWWKRLKSTAEASLESLAWELDVFTFKRHEALRFELWKKEMEACDGGIQSE